MTQWGIDALFNPGKRHMDEEKRRLQSTRQEIGDSSGGRRIDLDSGKVRLSGRPKDQQTDLEADADEVNLDHVNPDEVGPDEANSGAADADGADPSEAETDEAAARGGDS